MNEFHAIQFAEGLVVGSVTINASSATHSYTAQSITIQVFEPNDRTGADMQETPRTIQARCGNPGQYEPGTYAMAVQLPDGIWRVMAAGCDPLIEGYTPEVL